MKVGIYCRVSTDEQNIEQQKQFLIEYCRKQNFSYLSYIDEAISGKVSERPAWNKLLRDAAKGKVEAILVSKYDRITRDLGYAITFLAWIKKTKVRLISVYDSGTFSFSPDEIFNFKLKCLLSEYELEQLRWRSQIGIERAKREGKYKGRKKGSKNKI